MEQILKPQLICKKIILENEKFAQVVIFSKITDIPKDILKMTTENINEVIIVEDGTPKYGWGSDLIANICTLNNHKIRFKRLGANHHIIPASFELEQKILVSSDQYWET